MTDRRDQLDAQVRAADPDRWLSSRFVADADLRADLIALYAFEAELMVIPSKVTQPLLAEMRFTWWADQMDGVFAGEPRKGHPVLEALAAAVVRHRLDRAPLDALITAHIGRLHEEPHDLDAFYVGPMQTAARNICSPDLVAAFAPSVGRPARSRSAPAAEAISSCGSGEERASSRRWISCCCSGLTVSSVSTKNR